MSFSCLLCQVQKDLISTPLFFWPFIFYNFIFLSFTLGIFRQEFEAFLREVIRFGDLCKDPRWHNLGRSFDR